MSRSDTVMHYNKWLFGHYRGRGERRTNEAYEHIIAGPTPKFARVAKKMAVQLSGNTHVGIGDWRTSAVPLRPRPKISTLLA